MRNSVVFLLATAFILLVMCLTLSGCDAAREIMSPVETVEVKVPVLKTPVAPEFMRRTRLDSSELPEWMAPSDARAAVCLSAEGASKKRIIDADREGTLDIWEKWGFTAGQLFETSPAMGGI